MRTLIATLAVLGAALASAANAHDPIEKPRDPANETRLELLPIDATNDPFWRSVFAQLSEPQTRLSTFREARHFPFRRQPVELTGEIRIAPERGLSLRYQTPQEQIMIVDSDGVLMRDAEGRERRVGGDRRATTLSLTLTHILRFDFAALAQDFDLLGAHEETRWKIEFIPRDEALLKQLGIITVDGREARLNGIRMQRSAQQKIVITIGETIDDVAFTADEISHYFR